MEISLKIHCFGTFSVIRGGEEVSGFESDKARALLAYLAVEADQSHRREVLGGLLWPEFDDKAARTNLRRVLSNVRQVIGDREADSPALLATPQTIQLNLDGQVWVDVLAFQAGVEAADLKQREEATALYAGPFLDGLSVKDSAAFEDWLRLTRESCQRKMLETLSELSAAYEERLEYGRAAEFVRQALALEPWHEAAHRDLMRLLALDGRRGEALAQYEACRQILAEELGVEPAAETSELHQYIRDGEFQPGPVAAGRRTVRGYELRERLGMGGFGIAYRAYQPQVGRDVVIKVIRPDHANRPDFIRRFETEAHLVARLEHPHIVPLYDYWREPGGAYLVMRWLRGGSLRSALEQGPWHPEKALTLVEQIAAALATAHQQNIVHRDIKPANILLDEKGNAYLSDFGIAKDILDPTHPTLTNGITGSPAYSSPEELQNQPVTPQTDIYSLGIVLFELLTGQHPFADESVARLLVKQLQESLPQAGALRPELPPAVESVIQRATAKEPGDRFSNALALADALRSALRGEPAEPAPAQVERPVRNPYKGLLPFQEADAADFFGRKTLTEDVLARLAENRFLTLVGPSGSGKSSVVRAGLLPALRQGVLPGSGEWFVVSMHPGRHPLEEVEAALLRIAVNPPESLLGQMGEDERGLLRAVKRCLPDEAGQLLLFIDQFEELFTLVEEEAERAHFLNSLLAAASDERSQLRLVLTLRADFYDRPLSYPGFGQTLQRGMVTVLPLTPAEVEESISGPAAQVGLKLEPGLVTTITADVLAQPGALPLLQYALTELYERREGRRLTLDAYVASGGVQGALTRRAEEIYEGLDEAGQEAARQLFLRLVTLGEGAEDTRRPVPQSEVLALTREADGGWTERPGPRTDSLMAKVMAQYGRYRLLTFDRQPQTREPTVEVAHEALLHSWGRLRRWLEKSRDDIRRQRALAVGTGEWLSANQDPAFLWRGSRLAVYEEWQAETSVALTGQESEFLAASLAEREREAAVEAERRAREEALERRSIQRLRLLAAVLLGATVIALALTGVALNRNNLAQRRAREAQARELAAAAISNLTVDPQRSILLAVAAVNQTVAQDEPAVPEAIDALHRAIPASRIAYTVPDTSPEECQGVIWCSAVAFSTDGQWLATSGAGNSVVVLEAATGETVMTLPGHVAPVTAVAFHPNGEYLASAAADGAVIVWDLTGAKLLNTLRGHEGEALDVAFGPDGDRLATAGRDGLVKVWAWETGEEMLTLSGHERSVRDVAFSPDGTRLATGSSDQTIRVWDGRSGAELLTIAGHADRVFDIAFSPDGAVLAAASWDATVRLWDAASGQAISTLVSGDHGGYVYAVTFSPDGRRIATGGVDAVARVWDAATGRELLALAGHTGVVVNLAFSPDGRQLASGSVDGTVKLWDVTAEGGREWLTLAGHRAVVFGVTYSPDGRRLATASFDGRAIIWDATTGRSIQTLMGHQERVATPTFSPDGSRLATASFDGTVIIWDAATGENLMTLEGHAGRVVHVAYSPDGRWLATAGDDGPARIWDAASGENVLNLTGHDIGLERVAFSPDGTYLASSDRLGVVIIHEIESGRAVLTLRDHEAGVSSVAFSPDGQELATANLDGTAKIWDVSALGSAGSETEMTADEALLVLSGHSSEVWHALFSPDGSQLATISTDGTARLWDAASGEQLLVLDGGNDGREVAFSPDGKYLAATSGGGLVRIYVLPLPDLLSLAESRLTRRFTAEECRQYLHLSECPETP